MRSLCLLAIALLSLPALARGGALQLPPRLKGKAVVLAPSDPDYARAALDKGVKVRGGGGLSAGIVVKLNADLVVYRLYNGPKWTDSQGRNNRFGQWWTYDRPHGTQTDFRRDYAVCQGWNEVSWVTTCKLKKGSVVAIGPGQSVDQDTCAKKGESYPANQRDWQIWISEAWSRNNQEIVCPSTTKDYLADRREVSRPDNAGKKKPASKAHKPQLN